jgi:hypothetical protein
MILLLGLWTFVRAMTLGSAAIALENGPSATNWPSCNGPSVGHRSMGSGLLGGPLAMLAKLASQLGDRPARHGHLVAPPGV